MRCTIILSGSTHLFNRRRVRCCLSAYDRARRSGLDGSDQGGDEIGSLDAGVEVLVGGPVGLDRCDVAGDSLLVEKEVLGGVGNEGLGLGEDSGPLLDGGEVVVHSSVHARSHVGLEVEDELLELLDGGEDVEGLEVLERGIKVGPERGDARVAGLNLFEMVVTDHAVDETSSEVWEHHDVKSDNLLGGNLNGANGDGEQVSGGLASLVVFCTAPVNLDGVDVAHDLGFVEDHMLGNGRNQVSLVSEDGSPLLDSLEIVTHALASGEGSGEGSDGGLNILGSLEPVASLDSLNDSLDISDGSLTIGEAGGDLGEMVVANHAFEKATNEEERSIEWHVGDAVLNGTDSKSQSGGGVLASVEVATSGPVSLFLCDVSLNLASVQEPVLGNSLGKLGGVSENLSPGLDGSDIIVHTLAGGHGRANLVPCLAGVLEALEVVSSFEVSDGSL